MVERPIIALPPMPPRRLWLGVGVGLGLGP